MSNIEILKIVFLFIAIWFTHVNFTKLIRNSRIPAANFIYQSGGITGFIYLQWIMP